MLMLMSSPSLAYASEEATTSATELDLEFLEFLGDIAGLESLGVDLDGLLGIENNTEYAITGDGDEN